MNRLPVEYLYVVSNGLTPIWEDTGAIKDGKDDLAKEAAKKMLVVDLNSDVSDLAYLAKFRREVVQRVREPPLNCITEACLNNTGRSMGSLARHLHDIFYMYGVALGKLEKTNPDGYHDASTMTMALVGNYSGLTGEIVINKNGSREPFYCVYGLDSFYKQIIFMNITYQNGQLAVVTPLYTDEATSIWETRGGIRPLTKPICGYSSLECPKLFWDMYLVYVIIGGILCTILFISGLCLIIFVIRTRQIEQARLNAEWQIPFVRLVKLPNKHEREHRSYRSLNSGPSTITNDSTYENENSLYEVYFLDKEPVLIRKHAAISFIKSDYESFVKLRKIDHDNLNKFIGLSIDGTEYLSVVKICARGSLQNIISKRTFSIDPFFMYCIIRDVAEGLNYLHHSFINCHGSLTSACCLVNDGWQVKITDYGLPQLVDQQRQNRSLWVAPEHLIQTPVGCSKPGDVYSFAIICSEVITRKPAWNISERGESTLELLYRIKKGGAVPIRPDLSLDGIEVSTALLHLIRDCWSEKPEDRPSSEVVCNLLQAMKPNNKSNLMDHVFNMLEEYTSSLELEVEERTKELTEEKKKADVLLGRMLPRQVAERLKLGQTVEPEGFDSVTVFFSDVVKFTLLAAKCTPFQVVNLLNDLYSNFDAIIEDHDAYKVESIGDGYLCVSGLPTRNGYAHIKEIVDMSLKFMDYVRKYRIPYLPRERVDLRIGINSGPCVAGVVGLSMPRYCLFGDTVNTASRMESNGKAGFIHMSAAAHDLLVARYSNEYETQSRGEVIIKGKGVMETFWIHGRKGEEHLKKFTPVEEPNIKPGSPFSSEEIKHENSVEAAMYKEFKRNETIDVL